MPKAMGNDPGGTRQTTARRRWLTRRPGVDGSDDGPGVDGSDDGPASMAQTTAPASMASKKVEACARIVATRCGSIRESVRTGIAIRGLPPRRSW